MLDSVTNGRPGTGMVKFSNTLSNREIESVVDYVRLKLMTQENKDAVYHTEENGWADHQRYKQAFPFITGELSLSMPWESLNPEQRRGRELFVSSCIICHDSHETHQNDVVWELSAASYPRKHYSHKLGYVDGVSGASVHEMHEQPVSTEGLSEQAIRGRALFLDNCAFCHAPDGTARNWIGSFLEPRPRNFTANTFTQKLTREFLQNTILNGVNGTSMPAWKSVLQQTQIDDLITFMLEAFGDQVQSKQD
jgi:cytochrome c oxidase cbb3-type subunit 3